MRPAAGGSRGGRAGRLSRVGTVEIARTGELAGDALDSLRLLNEAAHGHPFVEDWTNAVGGTHFFIRVDGMPVSHAAVVERRLHASGHAMLAGYVEAVATLPAHQSRGLGSQIMASVTEFVRERYDLGGLCTGRTAFYEAFGWRRWRGPTFVRIGGGRERTPEEDGNVLVLVTDRTPAIDFDGPIDCEWRPGDVW